MALMVVEYGCPMSPFGSGLAGESPSGTFIVYFRIPVFAGEEESVAWIVKM